MHGLKFLSSVCLHSRYCIQHSRYTKQDGWRLYDLSLSLNGNIAVTGCNKNTRRTHIDVYSNVRYYDSRNKPKIIYSKEFDKYEDENGWKWWGRLISFYPGSDTTILSGLGDKLEVIDLIQDRVIKSRKIKLIKHGDLFGSIQCLSVRETEIFIGFRNKSNKITVYDVRDLNEIKSIILQGIQDGYFPNDMTVISDRIFVCVVDGKGGNNYKSLIFEEKNGRILSELTKPTDSVTWYVMGITLNITLNVVAVAWSQTYEGQCQGKDVIVFYSLLSENNCSFLIVEVEFGVFRIRISDKGDRIIWRDSVKEELKVFDLADLFTYNHLKENLIPQLQRDECVKLINYFGLPPHQADAILKSKTPKGSLLLALEERGVIQPSSVNELIEAFNNLNLSSSSFYLLDFYRQTRRATSYDRFLATLSAHLTASLPENLCTYFNISDEKRQSLTVTENPGLSLLMVLDEMGVIKSSSVEALEQPLSELKLVQAVAKIHEYQSVLEEEKSQLWGGVELTLEDKKQIFVQCLKKKIQTWYETMTPVPWKKSCRWKSTELFVGSGLVLTDSKAKRNLIDIDEKCKLNYTEIFSHDSLETEKRIILEGDPGSGKTMLASQLAYNWSQGEITEIDILMFLPLKFVQNKTLVESLKDFYMPQNKGFSTSDIEDFLTDEANKCCFILDGLEEYNGGEDPSEVMQVMTRTKYPSCKVILTSRSEYAQNLPACPMLKLGRFSAAEREAYIEKVFSEDRQKQFEVKKIIEDNPFILDLCNTPVLFVLFIHNIETMKDKKKGSFDRVSPFMSSMVDTLFLSVVSKVTTGESSHRSQESASLSEIAYNGLCKGYQQLSWPKEEIEASVPNSKQWLESGIIVVDDTNLSLNEEDEHQILSSSKSETATLPAVKSDEPSTLSEIVKPVITSEEMSHVETFPSITQKPVESSPSTTQKPRVFRRFMTHIRKGSRFVKSRSATDDDTPASRSGQQSPSHSSSSIKDKNAEEVRSKAKHVTLEVKFLHKLMQEWFAAKHFAAEYAKLESYDVQQTWLKENLTFINLADLHYVLRFSCNLHPPCTHFIMKHLLKNRPSNEYSIPEHIMNCTFLCFAEYEGVPGPDILEAVAIVCSENILIHSEDSRLLQQAKVSMLKLASASGIMVKKIVLADLVVSVTKDFLVFNSGVTMEFIDTLHVIDISRWDQVLKDEDYPNIFKYITKCSLLEEANLHFPAQPPELDKETLVELVTDPKKVTWMIGPRVQQTLDATTGEWQLSIGDQLSATHLSDSDETLTSNTQITNLKAEAVITNEGGDIEIPDTDVKLHVPPGALGEDLTECLIQLRIILPGTMDELGTEFTSNTSTVVELLPNNLKLKKAAMLTLPHCLELEDNVTDHSDNARIFVSHHSTGDFPTWEEKAIYNYQLDNKKCSIWLNSFCWVKCEINGIIVKGKRIRVYTAGRKLVLGDTIVETEVGYYLDLPGGSEILRNNAYLIVDQQKPFIFLKKGKVNLSLTLRKIVPSTWLPTDTYQEIPFQCIANSEERSCPFAYEHQTEGPSVPFLMYWISQGDRGFRLTIRPQVKGGDI